MFKYGLRKEPNYVFFKGHLIYIKTYFISNSSFIPNFYPPPIALITVSPYSLGCCFQCTTWSHQYGRVRASGEEKIFVSMCL